jgi:DNA-binding response OmpR family regulator
MKILLAIDDDPARYRFLSEKLLKHDIIVAVVQNPEAAEILLDSKKVLCVMLDHDMPEWNGQYYAREILGPRSIPVCVSSANNVGAREISKILEEFEVPHTLISCVSSAPEERWMGWILDIHYAKIS